MYIYKLKLTNKFTLYFKNKQEALRCILFRFLYKTQFPQRKICAVKVSEKTRRLYFFEFRWDKVKKVVEENENQILIKLIGKDLTKIYFKAHQSKRKRGWSTYKKDIIEKKKISGEILINFGIIEKIELNDRNWKDYLGRG